MAQWLVISKNRKFPFITLFKFFVDFDNTGWNISTNETVLERLLNFGKFSRWWDIRFRLGSPPKSKNQNLGGPENLTYQAQNKYTTFHISSNPMISSWAQMLSTFYFFQFVEPCMIRYAIFQEFWTHPPFVTQNSTNPYIFKMVTNRWPPPPSALRIMDVP